MGSARFNWSLWDPGFSLQIRYCRIDSISLKAENRFVSWQTQQIFHPGYACGLEPLLVLARLKSCWELTVRMGILSQYQLLQTHAGTHRDLHTQATRQEEKKKEERKERTGRRRLGKWHDNWLLFFFNWIYSIKKKTILFYYGGEWAWYCWEVSVSLRGEPHSHPSSLVPPTCSPGEWRPAGWSNWITCSRSVFGWL